MSASSRWLVRAPARRLWSPRAWEGLRGSDGGSAVVEFIGLAVVLLVPLVYLVLVLGRVQAGAFAVEGAARSAARVYAGAETEEQAASQARAAVGLALRDHGFDVDPGEAARVECERTPCLQPEAQVRVLVRVDVDLPGVPAFLADVVPVRIPVQAESLAVVDRFAAGPAARAPA